MKRCSIGGHIAGRDRLLFRLLNFLKFLSPLVLSVRYFNFIIRKDDNRCSVMSPVICIITDWVGNK